MTSQDLRRQFLNYFKQQGHTIVPSSPVVPLDDPTLLFTNAGMNQFKDVFLGKSQREYKRATTSQKCIRAGGKHNDLENVGHTARHLTFFEMLGNFSFGDYFKEKAIQFAWEVTANIFKFPEEKVWITVFQDDDESFELWKKYVPEKRIVRMGEADNFWAMGDTGPCGPCSELYFDKGERYGNAASIKEDTTGERYMEFWNLVFMQFNRSADGKMTPLPKQSIDTGAGLERLASLKMGVDSVFGTDVLRGLIAQVETISGKKYEEHSHLAPAFHVIADHIRSLSFAIADGAQPSNIERGYVLRKILRRAVRYGKMLGLQRPFLAEVYPRLMDLMGEDYRELITAQERIKEILTIEEESFLRTLKKGGNILSTVIEHAKKSPQKEITGEEAFKLKDTYGLPIEEILLIAKDEAVTVNMNAYQSLEEQAKEKSRGAQAVHSQVAEENLFKEFVQKNGASQFTGFSENETKGKILGIVVNGKFVDSISEGQEGMIILDKTPFYSEKGGQAGDHGTLATDKALFKVSDCRSPFPDVIAHVGKMERGTLKLQENCTAAIDKQRRSLIARNHTATHLLHWALQQVLGPHIRQAGSLVEADRLRFDFNHHKALTAEEIRQIESLVNEKVRENSPVKVYELSFADVQKRHDIKQFFGDKYGATVRVIDIDYSKELCGGTHVAEVGTIGLVRILKEGSVAAGVRRIEAVTGKAAEELMYQYEDAGSAAAHLLKGGLLQLPEKTSALLEENKKLAQEVKAHKRASLKNLTEELSSQVISIGSIPFLGAAVELEGEELGLLADDIMSKFPALVLILASTTKERCQLLIRVSPALTQKGIQAGALIKEIASCIGGSGGGKAESAQAGGKNPEGVEDAFEKAKQFLQAAATK